MRYKEHPADFDDFVRAVDARLAKGAQQYGDSSFSRPEDEIIRELQEELEDVAGWAFIMWLRLRRQWNRG